MAEPEDRPLPAVVVNPTKIEPGTRRGDHRGVRRLGWLEPLWLETTVDGSRHRAGAHAVERGADVVLACGGDGTVRSVAQALAGTGVAMGLVPAGTGNLLARTIGTPLERRRGHARGPDRRTTGRSTWPDPGRTAPRTERVFLVMAGTGFDAAIMASTPEALKVRVGPLAYVHLRAARMRGRPDARHAHPRRRATAAPPHPHRRSWATAAPSSAGSSSCPRP